jgi:AraC-like DNA-binding protein
MRLFFGGIAGLAISRETAAAVFTASRHSVRHRDITLADLAGVACLSPFHFSRTFARAMGVSPHQLCERIRLESAMAEVARGKLPLAQIALSARFSSLGSFTRAFRRAMGCHG